MTEDGEESLVGSMLEELSGELEQLDAAGRSMLNRLDQLKRALQEVSVRAASMRASLGLLQEHVRHGGEEISIQAASIEAEAARLGRGISAMEFEVESLTDSMDEAEDDLDRLAAILLSGRKAARGH